MLKIKDITNIHFEITTLCNARCPLCVRNANGYPFNFGYPETHLTLDQIKKVFDTGFVQQLTTIDFCGNFGDFIVNPEALEILEYFYHANDRIRFYISTNGSARSQSFWQSMGALGPRVQVSFCLDGLEDLHDHYRLDTNWHTIIKNAQTFIQAGGYAIWKMIGFKHNRHQVDDCHRLSKELGFQRFDYTDHGRDSGPVFDRQGNLQYLLGDADPAADYNIQNFVRWYDRQEPLDLPEEKHSVDCYAKNERSIYMAADGSVYPCCYLGSYPRTFANGTWYQPANKQIASVLEGFNNNAIEVGLATALEWFNQIEQRWNKERYAQGRLLLCDTHCGRKYQHWDYNINHAVVDK